VGFVWKTLGVGSRFSRPSAVWASGRARKPNWAWWLAPCAVATTVAAFLAAGLLGDGSHIAASLPRLQHAQLTIHGVPYKYAIYVPSTYRPGRSSRLLVVIHGCNTTADAQAQISEYTPLAERYGFVVVYPDVNPVDVAKGRCWQAFFDPRAEGRGRGNVGAIAAMTHSVMRAWTIDPRRVYAIGISSGGFEASVLGADYPDLYAAIGIHSGAAYMAASTGCPAAAASLAVIRAQAAAALRAMGPRARVMPVILFHGDADHRIPYRCGEQAYAQWLATDDLVLRRAHRPVLASSPDRITQGVVSHGHTYTVRSLASTPGCTLLQFWTIHGMGHYWSGGTSDPSLGRYTDTRGPSAAVASWKFFSPLRRSYSVSGMCR
jgi:poly(hydroxyalkanoate) depolymerase family esterase